MIGKVLSLLDAQVTPLIMGPPGVGKSSFARSLAKEAGVRSFVLYLSHKADNEVHGQPVVAKSTLDVDGRSYTVVEQAPPRYALEAIAARHSNGRGALIVLDEVTCLTPQHWAPVQAILSEYLIGEIQLSQEDIGLIACGNPTEWASGGWSLTPPAANRFAHLEYKVQPLAWAEQFPGYWGDPPLVRRWGHELNERVWLQSRSMVAAYIRSHPDQLIKLPESAKERSGPYPTPRTWDYFSRALSTAEARGLSDEEKHEVLAGIVGTGALMQYLAWAETMNLPDPRELLADPSKFTPSLFRDRSDQLYYIMMSCLAEASHRKRTADESPGDQKLKAFAVAAWLACWKMAGKVVTDRGPKDIAAVVGHMLTNPDATPKGAPVPEEVVLLAPVVSAAGLNWQREKEKKTRTKK